MGFANTITLLRRHKGAVWVALLANLGSMLFGFDTGIAGAVTSTESFKASFGLTHDALKTVYVQSNVVAVLNAGAFFGALVPSFLGRRLGRPHTLALASLFLLLGGILQVAANAPSLSMLYGGRVISGFGVGIVSVLVPVYVAECSPKELRGLLMGLFEMFLVSGGVLSYWMTYGCSVHLAPTSRQWRIPLAIQVVLAGLILVASLVVGIESPRWLAKNGKWEAAENNLARLRGLKTEHPDLQHELAEIRAQIEEEIASTNGRTVSEFLQKSNWRRLAWGIAVPFWSIWCAHNAILYYGPSVFKQIGYTSQNAALLASGVITVVKFVCTALFLLGGVQVFGRKTLMATGAFFMSVFLFTLGALIKSYPPTAETAGTSAGNGMMAVIYLFIVAYSFSWGPLAWIYTGEMYPNRFRDYGMAMSTMIVWAMNYIVSKVSPIAIVTIGWKTWMIFGTTNACACIFALFLPETKGKSLEETDVLFGVVAESVRREDIETKLEQEIKAEGKSPSVRLTDNGTSSN
ncbi:hypothetical protein LTR85_007754 [Meristemomyces frigidus]|nr:hypothetical protein LTR85_007754 [Meristemomyces frigidus]